MTATSGVVVELSGTGTYTSRWAMAAQGVSGWSAFPVGWITLVLGVIVIGSAALHYGEILESDQALKTVALPGFLSGAVAAVVMANKTLIIDVPKYELDGVSLSSGAGAIFVLIASIAVVVLGFMLSALDEPAYVPRRVSFYSHSTAAASKSNRKAAKKKAKKKAAKKKAKKAARAAAEHQKSTTTAEGIA